MSKLREAWNSASLLTGWNERMSAAITEAEETIARLTKHVELLQEKVDPDKSCACAYDAPDDVCLPHSPIVARLTRERDEAQNFRQLYRECAHVDVTMENGYFMGVSRNEFKNVWEDDTAALKGDKP